MVKIITAAAPFSVLILCISHFSHYYDRTQQAVT